MPTSDARTLRDRMTKAVRDYEGHLLRLESQLRVLRGKAKRAGADVQAKLAEVLARAEQEAQRARDLGSTALEGLARATETAQSSLADLKNRLEEVGAGGASAVVRGREVVRRATIEAKAIRHGVRVGIRMAKRVARRTKAGTRAES